MVIPILVDGEDERMPEQLPADQPPSATPDLLRLHNPKLVSHLPVPS